jgi:hypothetical protein
LQEYSLPGPIIWTETNAVVVSAIAYDAQKVAFAPANFDNLFMIQLIGRNQAVGQFLCVSAKPGRKHLRVLIIYFIIDEAIIITAVEDVPAVGTIGYAHSCFTSRTCGRPGRP